MVHRLLRAVIATSAILSAVPSTVLGHTQVQEALGTACYRRTALAVQKQCSAGFTFDKALTCWANCNMQFPVQCGMECIPQNQDCTKEVITKVASVAQAFFQTASLVTPFSAAFKGVEIGVKCGQGLFGILDRCVSYSNELEANFPNKTSDQLLSLAMQSDLVAVDLPLAVTTCLNLPVPANMESIGKTVSDVVKKAAQAIIKLKSKKMSISDFRSIMTEMFKGSPAEKTVPSTDGGIQTVLDTGKTCGKDIKDIIDQVVGLSKQVKADNPSASASAIRITVGATPLVTKALPSAISDCSKSASQLLDIRKFVDQTLADIYSAAEQNGKPATKGMMAISIANMALGAVATFDPTGISAMVKEYLQPLCDPTALQGPTADGSAADKLGLKAVGGAFQGSSGDWKNAGDGMVKISFKSSDSKDVKVNVISGGKLIDQVPVKAGGAATWTKALKDLQDKTLYLDRWRPGMLGLPGTGGGSLLCWVPHASAVRANLNFTTRAAATNAGHLELLVKIQAS